MTRFTLATLPALLFTLATVTPASADYRADGVVYDTSVAAACNVLTSTVFFAPGESALEIHDYAPLDYLADCLTDGALENVGVAVVGFTDPAGPAAINVELGEERANAVIDYLVAQGVPRTQLLALSFGESAAIANDVDPEDWAVNRKVELWIVPDTRPVADR